MTRSQTHHDKRLIDGSDPDDWGQRTCPDCDGDGWEYCRDSTPNNPYQCPCSTCDGSGYIDPERAAEDAAEAHGDLLMEMARDAAIEHATGFEE